jgi:drug/metabolite transporter (DMT)-like permease
MIWAVGYGLVLFGDFPDAFTWMGAAVVVAAGITMIWRDRQLDRAAAQSP